MNEESFFPRRVFSFSVAAFTRGKKTPNHSRVEEQSPGWAASVSCTALHWMERSEFQRANYVSNKVQIIQCTIGLRKKKWRVKKWTAIKCIINCFHPSSFRGRLQSRHHTSAIQVARWQRRWWFLLYAVKTSNFCPSTFYPVVACVCETRIWNPFIPPTTLYRVIEVDCHFCHLVLHVMHYNIAHLHPTTLPSLRPYLHTYSHFQNVGPTVEWSELVHKVYMAKELKIITSKPHYF